MQKHQTKAGASKFFIKKTPKKVSSQEDQEYTGSSMYDMQKKVAGQTKVSRDIRILAEVEKIWIIYDIDNNKKLDIDEVTEYL